MKEIWKEIKNYEELYEISNYGRIRSKERYINARRGKRLKKVKILTPFCQKNGYYAITLWKYKSFKLHYIHRLVAIAFIENENCLEQVNHKNGDKKDNNVENLEWVSRSENMKHAISLGLFSKSVLNERINKMNEKVMKPVCQIKDGKVIKTYKSATLAGKELGHKYSNISACCRGLLKTSCGFQWKWKD